MFSVWKGKVKKALSQSNVPQGARKSEMTSTALGKVGSEDSCEIAVNVKEISDLYLEGLSIPINTRVVQLLASILESTTEESKGRKKKEGDSRKEATAERESKSRGKRKTITVPFRWSEFPDSSDDEGSNLTDNEYPTNKRHCKYSYREISEFQKSNVPDIWPVKSLGNKPHLVRVPAPPTGVSGPLYEQIPISQLPTLKTNNEPAPTPVLPLISSVNVIAYQNNGISVPSVSVDIASSPFLPSDATDAKQVEEPNDISASKCESSSLPSDTGANKVEEPNDISASKCESSPLPSEETGTNKVEESNDIPAGKDESSPLPSDDTATSKVEESNDISASKGESSPLPCDDTGANEVEESNVISAGTGDSTGN